MREIGIQEAMASVGRLPVCTPRGDGILKIVKIPDGPGGEAMAMATVARHHGPDVSVPLFEVRALEHGDLGESKRAATVIWVVSNAQGPIQAFEDRTEAEAFAQQFGARVNSCALIPGE